MCLKRFACSCFLIFQLLFFPNKVSSLSDSLCIRGIYGRNANRIITLANGLAEAQKHNLTLALNKEWTLWYKTWFDMHEIIRTNFVDKCHVELKAKVLYRRNRLDAHNYELSKLRPKKIYWLRAQHEINKRREISITVHRRWFEGECRSRAQAKEYFCKTSADFLKVCYWTESEIKNQLNMLMGTNITLSGGRILLFSDHQMLKYDKTFKKEPKRKFQVEMCMMALSHAHFGSPMSSIDYIIAHWRHGSQFPIECFMQIHAHS